MSQCKLTASAITSTMKSNELVSDQSREPICSVNSSRHFSFSENSCQLTKAVQSNSLEESRLKRQRCSGTEVTTKISSIGIGSIKSHLSLCSVQSESPKWRTRGELEVKWFGHSTHAGIRMVCLAVLCVAALSMNSITCVVLKSQQGNTLSNNIPYKPNHRAWRSSEQEQKNWNTIKYADDREDDRWPQESSETDSYSDVTVDVAKSDDNVCNNDNCIEITGLLTHVLDKNVKPCDDFYKFTCGNYASFYPIPKFLKSWNNFERVYYDIRKQLTGRLNDKDEFAKVIHNITYFEKLNQFYQGCINQKQRDISGYHSLFKLIEELGGWPMINEEWTEQSFNFEKTYSRLTKLNLFFFVRIEAMTDHKNPKNTIFRISPPYKAKENIVNLEDFRNFRPTREFSFSFEGRRSVVPDKSAEKPKPETTTDRMTIKYKEVIKELKLSSLKDPKSLNMTAFEISLDQNFIKISDVQNYLEKKAKPMSPTLALQWNNTSYMKNLTEIEKLVGFNLTFLVEEMFGIRVTDTQQFFVPDHDYLKDLGKLLDSTEKSIISNYFITNMVMSLAGHTTSKMINLLITKLDSNPTAAHEQFENICFEEASLYMPELLGKLYLYVIDKNNHTNCTTCTWKKDVDLLVKLLRESFYQLLTESKWMEKETINEAITKLENMSMNIGFPEWYGNEIQFEQYCDMFTNINQNDYFNSVVNVNEAGHSLLKQQHSERASGGTSAQLSWPGHRQIIDVNAFYYFASNGVYIPVAIAQYPFYVPKLPKAVIFGSLGMIIGHEMTHAFDNTGRLYDHQGALTNWWTDKTLESFNDKTNCFVEQYSNFTINDSINIDGNQTLAENIADNGGLRQAYHAFKKYQNQTGSTPDQRMPASLKIYTPEQLFFISYAHMWCNQMDPDDIESDIRKNVHSPPQIRVFGTLANFDEFSKAFECPLGSRMNPKHKCVLW